MQKAIERKARTKHKDGRLVESQWSIGGALVWGIVALVLGLAGKAAISISAIERLLK
jgi:hypothetical protein